MTLRAFAVLLSMIVSSFSAHAEDAKDIAGAFASRWVAAYDAGDAPALAALFTQDGVLQAAPAPRFGRTPAARPRPPGAPGADTHAVLKESGATDEEVRQWQAAGALT